MTTASIENKFLRVIASANGAELTSIQSIADNTEYLWQADPAFWPRHAPILFPIVGKLKDNSYSCAGSSYTLTQHGFARDSVFEVVDQTDTSMTFQLKDSEKTYQHYPFSFVLNITYQLLDKQLAVKHTVINTDQQPLYFSIGGHPAFRCPIEADEAYDDYYLEFEQPESTDMWLLNEDGLIARKQEQFLDNQQTLDLSQELFSQDALIFKHLESERISLKSRKSAHCVTVEFPGFPYLGIWSKGNGAPFVCIEPWYGLADSPDTSGDITRKQGIQELAPQQVFRATYSLSFS